MPFSLKDYQHRKNLIKIDKKAKPLDNDASMRAILPGMQMDPRQQVSANPNLLATSQFKPPNHYKSTEENVFGSGFIFKDVGRRDKVRSGNIKLKL
jgi:hypothetical protein